MPTWKNDSVTDRHRIGLRFPQQSLARGTYKTLRIAVRLHRGALREPPAFRCSTTKYVDFDFDAGRLAEVDLNGVYGFIPALGSRSVSVRGCATAPFKSVRDR